MSLKTFKFLLQERRRIREVTESKGMVKEREINQQLFSFTKKLAGKMIYVFYCI